MSDITLQPTPPLTPQARYDAALAALPVKQRRFVAEYLVCLNGTQAAIRAGYSERSARSEASRMLTFVNIRAAVSAGMDIQAMPAEEVLARLSAQARGDMADFLRIDEEEVTLTWSLITAPVTTNDDGEIEVSTGDLVVKLAAQEAVQPTDRILHTVTVKRAVARLDLMAAGKADKLGLIKKYSLDDNGKVSIEMYDAQKALELLGKHRGLFVDRKEITGKDGGAIAIEAFAAALATAYADPDDDNQSE
jgi:phage terminase small subunit